MYLQSSYVFLDNYYPIKHSILKTSYSNRSELFIRIALNQIQEQLLS